MWHPLIQQVCGSDNTGHYQTVDDKPLCGISVVVDNKQA
jgi:hypothetical protein